MTTIQAAMLGKLTYTAMADAIFTHPLLAEGLNTVKVPVAQVQGDHGEQEVPRELRFEIVLPSGSWFTGWLRA